MPVKSYTAQNGKRKYYASFYYTDYTGQRRKKKKEGFTTSAAAKQFERDFTKSAPDYVGVIRLPDAAQSFFKSSNLRFSNKNPYDF